LPYVAQVAVGMRPYLNVWGDDYDTDDGTGVRDYIHVIDLAKAHLNGLEKLFDNSESFTVNLGTGKGYSVLEVVTAFERASQKKVPIKIASRRPGDVGEYFADCKLAYEVLGWQAELSLDDMCKDHWNWQKNNPEGYK